MGIMNLTKSKTFQGVALAAAVSAATTVSANAGSNTIDATKAFTNGKSVKFVGGFLKQGNKFVTRGEQCPIYQANSGNLWVSKKQVQLDGSIESDNDCRCPDDSKFMSISHAVDKVFHKHGVKHDHHQSAVRVYDKAECKPKKDSKSPATNNPGGGYTPSVAPQPDPTAPTVNF